MSTTRKNTSAAASVSAYLLSFVLSIILLLGTVAAVVRFAAFEHKNFAPLLSDEYCTSIYNAFIEDAKDYTLPTSIDPEVVNGAYTPEDARRDIGGYVAEAFGKGKYMPDLAASEARLRSNVQSFFDSVDVETDGELSEIIDSYVSDISELYRTRMHTPGIEIIQKARGRVVKYTPYALAGICVLALALALIIVFSHRSDRSWPRYMAYVCGAAGLMTVAAPAVLAISRAYERISLAPEYFYRFIMDFIRHMLKAFFIASAIWFGLMVVFIVIALLIGGKKTEAAQDGTDTPVIPEASVFEE